MLARACQQAGGQAAWARLHGIAPGYVSDVLRGHDEPGKRLLAALGLERVVDYRPVEDGRASPLP